MGIVDGNALPVALSTGSASPHELKYVEQTLDNKAYDSDPLDRRLEERNVEQLFAWLQNYRRIQTGGNTTSQTIMDLYSLDAS